MTDRRLGLRALRMLASIASVGILTFVARVAIPVNATTVGFAYLLLVLVVATTWGFLESLACSIFATLCFNFFFLEPVGTLTISDPQNWVALATFLIVALTAGQLSARAKRRAEEAEVGRREIERLYHELQAAFERESQMEALRQSERLKS